MRCGILTLALALLLTSLVASLAVPSAAHELDEVGLVGRPVVLPRGATLLPNIPYGPHAAQRLDVYRPAQVLVSGSPVILMVHGGGWRRGDKAGRGVVGHKAMHWLPSGYILVSMSYRMLPEAGPATQAEDVAAALVYVQQNARSWGGDGRRIVVMGHSAGAHLVALLAADSDLRTVMGVEPWPASVLLDSAAYDVVSIMEQPHPRLYDGAFGRDPVLWAKASPSHRMVEAPSPMLLVCSEKRDVSCPSATAFAGRIAALGGTADVVPVDLSHLQINTELGLETAYTGTVNLFLRARGLP